MNSHYSDSRLAEWFANKLHDYVCFVDGKQWWAFDPETGRWRCNPNRVQAHIGDFVRWVSEEGGPLIYLDEVRHIQSARTRNARGADDVSIPQIRWRRNGIPMRLPPSRCTRSRRASRRRNRSRPAGSSCCPCRRCGEILRTSPDESTTASSFRREASTRRSSAFLGPQNERRTLQASTGKSGPNRTSEAKTARTLVVPSGYVIERGDLNTGKFGIFSRDEHREESQNDSELLPG